MRILGAILAGGKSRRFGSDKAVAVLGEHSLMEHSIQCLEAQTDGLVICGRIWPGVASLADRPTADLGPLGGLNAALHHAENAAFDAVLCTPIDVHPLPVNLRELLEGAEAKVFELQHSVGFWPVRFTSVLDRHLAGGNRSFRSWIESAGASVASDQLLRLENLNTISDLQSLVARPLTSPFPNAGF